MFESVSPVPVKCVNITLWVVGIKRVCFVDANRDRDGYTVIWGWREENRQVAQHLSFCIKCYFRSIWVFECCQAVFVLPYRQTSMSRFKPEHLLAVERNTTYILVFVLIEVLSLPLQVWSSSDKLCQKNCSITTAAKTDFFRLYSRLHQVFIKFY